MIRQSVHQATTPTRVLSFPQKSFRQLTNTWSSTQKPCICCLPGFARFDTKIRTTPFSFVDRFFEREASRDMRTSGAPLVCNCRYYGGIATLYFDGGSKGRKGPGGAGAYLLDGDGNVIWEGYKFCKRATSTQAEYHALILGLTAAREAEIDYLTIYGDADGVLNQVMRGRFDIKSKTLKRLHPKACDLAQSIHYIGYSSSRKLIVERS